MIGFRLKQIIESYNKKHLHNKLTITELSRDTGISRHSLSQLCGKYKPAKGIAFSTLNELMNFFDLPVTSFLKYVPDGMHITLSNMSDKLSAKHIRRHETMKIRHISTLLNISDSNDHKNLAMAFAVFLPMNNELLFLVKIYPLRNNGNAFLNFFRNNADKQAHDYIYSRVIAHSDCVPKKIAEHANKFIIMPSLSDKDNLDIVRGLNKNYLLNPTQNFKTNLGHEIITDKSSNQFKINRPTGK